MNNMDYKSVDIGKDMFLNDVYVGQKVLYLRAAPGGVGIGEVTKIEIVDKSNTDTSTGNEIVINFLYFSRKFTLKKEVIFIKIK